VSPFDNIAMRRLTFQLAFTLGPTLAFGIIPNAIFALANAHTGATNMVWGPVFGAGFWLADFAFWKPGPNGSAGLIKIAGLLWAFLLIPAGLFLTGNWLWGRLGEGARKIALLALLASCLLIVPVRAFEILARHAIILPDWALYIDAVY
jgi:hypothetical protein